MEESQFRYSTFVEEYKLCESRVQSLDTTIWQTSSVFGIGSVLGVIALFENRTHFSTSSILIISLVPIALLSVWYRFARRWWSIQHLAILRMKHLEQDALGFRMQYYVTFRDTYEERKNNRESLPQNLTCNQTDIIKQERYEYRGIQPMTDFVISVCLLLWLFPSIASLLKNEMPIAYAPLHPIILIVLCGLFSCVLGVQWRKNSPKIPH